MRDTILMLLVALPVVLLVVTLPFALQMRAFLQQTPELGCEDDLARLKRLARGQMIGALLVLTLLIPLIVLPLVGIVLGQISLFGDLLYLLWCWGVMLGAGQLSGVYERQIHAMPAKTPELRKARDAVVTYWKKQTMPPRDW